MSLSINAVANADPIEIYGQTTTTNLEINGIANTGVLHFGAEDPADPENQYVPPPSPGNKPEAHLIPYYNAQGKITSYEFRGWAWSDNLGWISFYCEGGDNEGSECGGFPYKVTIDADTDLVTGWAWNSALGWISFSGQNHTPPKILDGYGVEMDKFGNFKKYAWTQPMGYINFNGVRADVPPTIQTVNCDDDVPGVCVDITTSEDVKVADGSDAHELHIYINDAAGNPIPKALIDNGTYRIRAFFKWDDTLKRIQAPYDSDQGLLESIPAEDTLYYTKDPFQQGSGNLGGAISYKPIVLYTQGAPALAGETDLSPNTELLSSIPWEADPSDGSIELDIKSYAPSTSNNFSTKADGFPVSNEDFTFLPGVDFGELEENALRLKSVEWSVEKKNPVTNKYEPAPGKGEYYVSGSPGTPVSLPFSPAIFVQTFNSGLTDPDSLWLYRNVPEELSIGLAEESGSVFISLNNDYTRVVFRVTENEGSQFDTGLTLQSLINSPFSYDQESISVKRIEGQLKDLSTTSLYSPQIESKILIDEEDLPDAYNEGVVMYSVVTYRGYTSPTLYKTVTYFSNKLPRKPGAISNPAAEIIGTTYDQGTGAGSIQEGVTITSVGDVNVNIVRDFIYEKVQKILIGKTVYEPTLKSPPINSITSSMCNKRYGCTLIDLSEDHNEEIYYFNLDTLVNIDTLVLSSGDDSPITYDGLDKVIIVAGGNIHIESNLESQNDTNLGLIALREQGDGLDVGHIYISPDPTKIEALIIADGSIFSSLNISENPTFNQYGEPDAAVDPEIFKKRLEIIGGSSSRNYLGSYDLATNFFPTPRGSLKPMDSLINQAIAKQYDLNYLRYFALEIIFSEKDGSPINLTCGPPESPTPMSDPDYDTKCAGDGIDFAPYPEGDLALPNADSVSDNYIMEIGQKLFEEGVIKAPIVVTDRYNPLYVIYKPKSEDSYIFSEDKNLTF